MKKRINVYPGEKFGLLTVIEEVEPFIQNLANGEIQIKRMIRCSCSCGRDAVIKLIALRTKNHPTKSCGCLARKEKPYHLIGLHKHPLHCVWRNIKQRCYNKKAKVYSSYGGRGISVCDKWLNDFVSFYVWCLKNGWEQGLQIDRYPNNNGNYSPENCRITTPKFNSNNRRDTLMVTLDGNSMPLRLACDKLGLKGKLVWQTMNRRGIDFTEAIKRYERV